jgi:hypothetical protein
LNLAHIEPENIRIRDQNPKINLIFQ